MPLFGSRKARPHRPTDILERPEYGWIWKPLLGLGGIYLAVTLALGAWWSLSPDGFDVQQASAEQRGRLATARTPESPQAASGNEAGNESAEGEATTAAPAEGGEDEAAGEAAAEATAVPLDTSPAGRGAVIIASQMTLLDTLLDKPGGYLRNDVLPPGLWLDNMPAWELGVLRQARGLAHALTERGVPEEGAPLEARERLDGDSKDWLYPSTEHRLAKARDAYAMVLGELNDQHLALPGEGDVPAYWLSRVARRLDELTHRLSASVADPEALRELEVDVDQLPGRTPWYRVDDIFFEARGQAWAIEHLLAAMVADYGDVVRAADAEALVERLQVELAQAQRRLWSPMVLNGTGFGIFANHSLMMAAYTQRAAQLAEALSGRLAGVTAPVDSAPVDSAKEPASDAAAPQSAGLAGDAGEASSSTQADKAGDSESTGSEGGQESGAMPESATASADATSPDDGGDRERAAEGGASAEPAAAQQGGDDAAAPGETVDQSGDETGGQDSLATGGGG